MRKCFHVQFQFHDTQNGGHSAGLLIEQLRYAGVVTVVRQTDDADGNGTWYVLRLHCPAGTGSPAVWADQNAARMQSFGLNAEVYQTVA